MAANTNPVFTLAPIIGMGQLSAANTALNGTGTVVAVCTGGTNGTRIQGIVIQATATTTAGVVRLFVYNGSVTVMFKEYLVSAIVPSATVMAFRTEDYRIDGLPIFSLPATWILRASTHNSETFNVFAIGGDY